MKWDAHGLQRQQGNNFTFKQVHCNNDLCLNVSKPSPFGHNTSGQEKIPIIPIDHANIELSYFIIKPNPAFQNESNQYNRATKCFLNSSLLNTGRELFEI